MQENVIVRCRILSVEKCICFGYVDIFMYKEILSVVCVFLYVLYIMQFFGLYINIEIKMYIDR